MTLALAAGELPLSVAEMEQLLQEAAFFCGESPLHDADRTRLLREYQETRAAERKE